MIPISEFSQWRSDELCIQAGRRLKQNDDFRLLLAFLEKYALMHRAAPRGAAETDVSRLFGEGTGHSQIIHFLYSMDEPWKTPSEETPEATFGTKLKKPQ